MKPVTIQAVSIAAIMMMVVSLIFIPNPICALWVAFSIISIEMGVAGYMVLWGVNLDGISMICLIMCIGFSVDFSAHISYAFMSAEGSPEERVMDSLHHLGLPILQGSVSTVLGVFTLIFTPSYIFITFFKVVFLVILFGAMHGLFLLPVLLSLFGPGVCSKREEKNTSSKQLTHPFFKDVENDNQIKIPRPLSSINETPTITSTPVLNGGVLVNKGASNLVNDSHEKDLGLGTSGEDSSESSLTKTGAQTLSTNTRERLSTSNKKSKSKNPYPILEMYNNAGYVSDDDHYNSHWRTSPKKESHRGGTDRLYHTTGSQLPRRPRYD